MQLRNKHAAGGGSATRASPAFRNVVDMQSTAPRRRGVVATRAQAGDPQVICFGEALFDFLADQKGLKRAEVKSWTPYPGGAPCNVATALQRLGTPTAFVSALGTDDRGQEIMALLTERGVDTSGVQRNDRPTRDIYAERTLDGDRVFAGFGLATEEYCDVAVDAQKLPLDKIKAAKLLIMGTLGLAEPQTRAAMEAAVKAAHEGGCKVLVDINWRPVFWRDLDEAKRVITQFLGDVDLVKISDADLEFLYEMDPDAALKDPCSVAQLLPKADGVLVTAGDKGAAYCFHAANKGEHTGFVPVFEVDVVDTTGAGDAFTAGFAYKLLEAGGVEHLGSNPDVLKKAVVFAAATGALTCTRPGAIAAQPSLEEVQKLYEKSKAFDHLWNQANAK